jgi:hypothetical protein
MVILNPGTCFHANDQPAPPEAAPCTKGLT